MTAAPAAAPPASTDVLVVGAGIAGSALAYELARRGVDCLLVEHERPGAGASGVPVALINPHRGRSARASAADLEGARAFWELTAALEREGGVSGARRSGVLRVPDQERQARAWRRLAQASAAARWLESAEVPAPYHAPHGALLVEGGGWADTRALLSALTAAAQGHGATLRTGTALLSLEAGAGAPVRALLETRAPGDEARRQVVACRAAVVATGAWQPPGVRLPRFELVWGAALVLDLAGAPTPPYPLAGGAVAAFPGGRAVITGGHRSVPAPDAAPASLPGTPAGARPDTGADADPAGLRRALAWQLPLLGSAPELSRWEGVRAKRPSGEPVARRLCPGVYLMNGFGGRGFLRAASVAARLAERLATGA